MNSIIGALIAVAIWACITAFGIVVMNVENTQSPFSNLWVLWLLIFALVGALIGAHQ